MDESREYRIQQVAEDAAEGSVVLVPVPPAPWSCGECGQRAHGLDMHCPWCGRDREDVEV